MSMRCSAPGLAAQAPCRALLRAWKGSSTDADTGKGITNVLFEPSGTELFSAAAVCATAHAAVSRAYETTPATA